MVRLSGKRRDSFWTYLGQSRTLGNVHLDAWSAHRRMDRTGANGARPTRALLVITDSYPSGRSDPSGNATASERRRIRRFGVVPCRRGGRGCGAPLPATLPAVPAPARVVAVLTGSVLAGYFHPTNAGYAIIAKRIHQDDESADADIPRVSIKQVAKQDLLL
jgi:hypothetical protein